MYIDAYEFITRAPEDEDEYDTTIEFQSDNKDNYVGFTAHLSEDPEDIVISGPMSSILATKRDI
jgi:hypothetical protein